MHPIRLALTRLLAEAQARPGAKVSLRLSGALEVDCKVARGQVYVQIWRSSVWPSLQDWATVQKYWPVPFHAAPRRARQHGRCYLYACAGPAPAPPAACLAPALAPARARAPRAGAQAPVRRRA